MIPGMDCAAVLATPSFALHVQPFWESFGPDGFHTLKYTLPVRVLCIRNELSHELAGLQFIAFIAEFITFALGASLDATCGAKSSRLLTFASVALLKFVNFPDPGCQQDWASAAIHAAISMQDKVHQLFHLNPFHPNL